MPETPRHRAPSGARRPATWPLALAAVGLAAALLSGVAGTFALWTDSADVGGTSVSAGRLDLKVNGADALTAYGDLSVANMMPGNSTAGVLTVQNAGTVPLTYYVTSTSSNSALTGNLTVKVTADAAVTGSGTAETCAGTALAGAGTSFGGNLLGSAASQRTLAAGAAETLCVQATLSSTAPSSLQGQATNVTLTFQGSQVTP